MSVALNKSVHVNAPLTVHRPGVVVAKIVDKRVVVIAPVALGGRVATGRDGVDGADGVDGRDGLDGLDGVDGVGAYWGVEDW